MSICTRRVIKEAWNQTSGFLHIKFYQEHGDVLVANCYQCAEIAEYPKLANATKVTEALKKEIEADKAEFIEAHRNCVLKEVAKTEESAAQPTMQDFETRIRELANQVADTVIRKHKDYGRSGLQSPVLAPHIPALDALLVRQSDKYSRLLNLVRKHTPEVKESAMDTALDILGYDMLLAVEVERLLNV